MPALLYNHSCYSLMTSTLRIPQLVSFAVENGYDAIAVTDDNVLHGVMELYHLTKKTSVKPLYGLEIKVNIEDGKYPFVLFSASLKGFQEIIRISTDINTGNREYGLNGLLSIKDLIIVEIEDGSYGEHLWNRQALNELDNYISLLNTKQNLYYGIVGNKITDDNYYGEFYAHLKKISAKDKLIAMPSVYYDSKRNRHSFRIMNAIRMQTSIDDQNLIVPDNCHLPDLNEFRQMFDDEIIGNTDRLVALCKVNLDDLEKAELPHFPCPDGIDSKQYLYSLCFAGLKKRFNGHPIPERYVRRLEYELKVINDMGFSNYFLIVWDVILFARRNDIYVGAGRGSVTGCLAAYCLGITHIDPLKYGLIFERFLNPERISMPDIDIDFPDNKRQIVINYVRDKYGSDHIAHILSFGTFGLRQLIRDIGKVMGINTNTLNIINKTVGSNPNITLKEAYDNNERFRKAINSSEETKRLYTAALSLEGLPRHYTTHAAGIVFSDRPLAVNCPTMALNPDLNNTQYTMEYLEEMGLIKMDFLSLKNLSTIANIVSQVRETEDFDILKIPLDDKPTYQLISSAKTTGVFQLESDGMKNLLRKMKPRVFEDIIAAIALFRPGPMQNIPAYLAARENVSSTVYPHPSLEAVLKSTYGIMVYQEQIMQVAQIVAGFSLGKADILRKAVSKKNPEQMQSLKNDFLEGGIRRGYERSVLEKIFADIEKFGNYGFNKSHSVAYSLLAYQLAYLKANYPLFFYHSLLNSVINDTQKTSEYISECRQVGIMILPPDVNYSGLEYSIEENNLRFPLASVKGIGNVAAGKIITERNENGNYKDYFDFVVRSKNLVNSSIIEILIKCGALDGFGLTRTTMLNGLEEVFRYAELISFDRDGQMSFDFDLVSKPLLTKYADNAAVNSNYEAELIGFFLKGHPVEKYRKEYPETVSSYHLSNRRGKTAVLARIEKIKEHRTRTGEMMCFADGYDEGGLISLVFMPDTYRRYADTLKKYIIVYVEGTIDDRESVKVSFMKVLEDN